MADMYPVLDLGERTAEFIETILTRLTTIGACYLTLVCLMPEFLIAKYPIPFYLRRNFSFNCCCCCNGYCFTSSN